METTFNNLCNSCTNIGCEFQSGIVRTECAFYMRPTIGSIPKEQYENRLKADMVAMLEDLKQDIIAEAYGIETDCSDYVVNVADIDMVIQQKINAIEGKINNE